ncbi:MAG: protein phosphatase 2C domain-containing protein [Pseudomonadota bacterium]
MPQNEAKYDAATALIQGARAYQEDAVIADFPVGADHGVAIISDGMGGHAAGDIASKIVMTEVFCELKFQSADVDEMRENIRPTLLGALDGANACLGGHIGENPEVDGMGATLVAVAVFGKELFWASVGDSPLFLFRGGKLEQINEDHSMAPQIDQMVEAGMLDEQAAKNHPDRNALTSVLTGDAVDRIDCPTEPLELKNGDFIIAASDGLQFLENDAIARTISGNRSDGSAAIAQALIDAIDSLDDPDQDNTSIAVIGIHMTEADDDMEAALRSAFDMFASMEDDDDSTEDDDTPKTPSASADADAPNKEPTEPAE